MTFDECGIKFGRFKLNELFEKKTIKGVPKKEEDLTEVRDGYHIFGQNIQYQRPQRILLDSKYLHRVDPKYPILAYTSSVGEIGMIEEDFYRSGDNGAFQGLYPIKHKFDRYELQYVLTALKKQFVHFGYSTGMSDIMNLSIELPLVKDTNEIDYEIMGKYIKALEKVVIADVVKYKDRVIEATRKVVNK